MKSIIAAVLILATGYSRAQEVQSPHPHFTAFFSAVESKSYPGAQAYNFTLLCLQEQVCTLTRITFEECRQPDDKKGEVMNVWAKTFSTSDKSLIINFHSDRSLELRFSNLDVPWNADFRISLSFTKEVSRLDTGVLSVSGTVLKKLFNSKSETLIELRRAKAPIERLDRNCPVGLLTY